MDIKLFKDSFDSIVSRGIQDLNDFEAEALKVLNTSIVMAFIACIFTGILFKIIGLDFAAIVQLSGVGIFGVVYIFNNAFPAKKYGFILLIISMIANGLIFGYYGVTYGFHFLFVGAIILSCFNVETDNYRKYVVLIGGGILLVISLLFGIGWCPIAPVNPYGEVVTMLLVFIAIAFVHNFSRKYITMQEEIDGKRKKTIILLQQKNEEITSFNHTVAHDLKELNLQYC